MNIVDKTFTQRITAFESIDVDLEKCISYVYRKLEERKDDDAKSIRGGYQLRGIFNDPEWREMFQPACSDIYEAGHHWSQLSLPEMGKAKFKVYFCNMWVNFSPPGAYNVMHTHPNSNLSGVFYLKSNPNCGSIVFPDPYQNSMYAQECIRYEPKPGRGLVFSSKLLHYVETNFSSDDRISLSFNIRIDPI